MRNFLIATASDAKAESFGTIGMQTFFTIISGVLVFLVGQLILELVIKPIKRYKEIKAKIAYSLVYYANIYNNPVTAEEYSKNKIVKDQCTEAQECFRKLAAEMQGFSEEKWFFNTPKSKVVEEVTACLIGLSNSMTSPHPDIAFDHNQNRANKIKTLLKLHV